MGAAEIKNILSFDVEEWFVPLEPDRERWKQYPSRIAAEIDLLLATLGKYRTKATFFILVESVRAYPWILKKILAEGHEIASHGMKHRFIYAQTSQEFRDDLEESIRYLEKKTHQRIRGYRAPFFSINKRSLWALKILKRLGLHYDSSIFPVINHRYGIPDSPRQPYRLRESDLWEFPPATRKIAGISIGLGGVYFRLLPFEFIRNSILRLNKEGRTAVLYLHPWEFDNSQPRIRCSPFLRFRHYGALKTTMPRLEKLLQEFEFVTFIDVMNALLLKTGKESC